MVASAKAPRGSDRKATVSERVAGSSGPVEVRSTATAAAVLVTSTGSDPGAPAETVGFRSLPRDAFAEATIAPRPWGSEVSVKVYGFRPGALCQVWVRSTSGTRVPAGSFRYVYDGEGDHLSAAMTPEDVTAIGLRAGSKTYVAPLPRPRSPVTLDEASRPTERRPIA